MKGELVGRHADMAAIEAVLQETTGTPVALLLVGEPGAGKTALLRATMERSRELGLPALATRPSEMEASAPFAAVTDLLSELDGAIERLPAPQAHALRAATLRQTPDHRGVPAHTVSVALRNLLLGLGENGRLVVVIDDAQWLDDASRTALSYAARRLVGTPVRWIVSSRVDADEVGFGQALDRERLIMRRLAPLSSAALHGVIRAQLGRTLPRHLLTRIADASRGNPLHALELARAALADGDLAPGGPLPVATGPGELLLKRVQAMPGPTRRALLLLAAMDSPNVEELSGAGGEESVLALDEAEAQELIERTPSGLRFTHPLVAEAAYRAADPPSRRAAHLRLAGITAVLERRARHLGRGTLSPEAGVAAELEAGADAAVARGALAAAVELSEMAFRLTPPEDPDAQMERRLILAQRLLDMGELKRAGVEAQAAIDVAPPGRVRARARLILGNVLRWTNSWEAAQREAAAAEAEPDLDVLTMAQIADLRGILAQSEGEALEQFDRSITLLRQTDEPALLAELLLSRAEAAAWLGRGWDDAVVEEALELERRAPPRRLALNARTMQANSLSSADRLSEARAEYQSLQEEAIARGEDSSVMRLHMHQVRLELQAGRWLDAEQHALAFLELTRTSEDLGGEALALMRLAAVDAMLGREADARERLAHALPVAADVKWDYGQAIGRATLGLLELSLGNAGAAAQELRVAWALAAARGVLDPGIYPHRGDLAEALAEIGQLDEAEDVARELEADASRLQRVRSLAAVARVRALLGAARADTEGAIDAAERSKELLVNSELPFDYARTLIVAGRVHRRARHKSEAHRLLSQAVDLLDRLQTPLWAAQARSELARVGLRPSAPTSLTDTEAQVARLAARGLTNRQVADAAFITPRSVEGVLRRIYNKLGISSRAELGAAMAAEREQAPHR